MANGQLLPDPNIALVQARNARRIARRASVASLARSLLAGDFGSFTREQPRQVGGRFEEIEELPEPQTTADRPQGLPEDLISKLLGELAFAQQRQVIPAQRQVTTAPRSPFGRAATAVSQRIGGQQFDRFTPFSTGFFI